MSDILDYIEGAQPEQKIEPAYSWLNIACKNGLFFEITKPIFNAYNSLINRNLGFTEKFICKANEPYLWQDHYNNISKSVKTLFPEQSQFISSEDLHRKVEIFISKNHYPSYSRITLTVWKSDNSEQIEWAMFQEKLKANPYEFSTSSLVIGIYDEACIARLPIPNLNVPSVVDAFAERWRRENNYDAVCFINSDDRIIDTSVGNIYLIIDNQIVGINPNYGGHNDALSVVVERIAARNGFNVKYINGFQRKTIETADEILIVSSALGVKSVVGVGERRYKKQKSEKIAMLVSEYFIGA